MWIPNHDVIALLRAHKRMNTPKNHNIGNNYLTNEKEIYLNNEPGGVFMATYSQLC